MKIVAQKTENCSRQNQAEERYRITSRHEVGDRDRHRCDDGDSGSQPVENIDDVERIGDGENPKYRQRNGEPDWNECEFDVCSGFDQHQRGQCLAKEFLARRHDSKVVDQSDHQDDAAREKKA